MRREPMYGRVMPKAPSGSARADTLPMTDEEKQAAADKPKQPFGFGLPDPDYSCGAAYCDDPACNMHGPKARDA